MKRIAFTGPESSGKTTLSKLMAEHFSASWVPEFARAYLEKRGGAYVEADLEQIALGQLSSMQEDFSGDFVLFDTELIVLKIWSEYRFGSCSDVILNGITQQKIDVYFLCKPDIPWEAGPFRENQFDREELFVLYEAELKNKGFQYHILSGSLEERMKSCATILNELI